MSSPPIHVTQRTLTLCTEIGMLLGRIQGLGGTTPQPMLRRSNRIRTIHGTLTIEGNTLSLEQITDIVEGRRVLGPPKDIQEVRNALDVYSRLGSWEGTSSRSLLAAHGKLMQGLADDAGRWRTGNVGVLKGTAVAHLAPPPHLVPSLMEQLFAFLAPGDDQHWLVKAAVFHYELEFIHPFSDGNGRMGRLWQQVLLFAHHPAFEYLPIESLVRDHQGDYYRILGECDREGESTAFVEFMLELVQRSLTELFEQARPGPDRRENRVERALAALADREFSRKDYMHVHRRISSATASRDLHWAVEQGLLVRRGDKARARYSKA